MDPTSRRLVARIALWTGAILVLMAIWFFAIQPQLTPSADMPGDEDIIVPEESSGEEAPAEESGDPATAEAEADSADRNSDGEVVDEDGISEDDVAAPEPSDPDKPVAN